ncbi:MULTISPECIES: hypothetical protein [Phenylobacterium]|uniref:Uncharacterized protein n=1 Tax=Phenylobacterium koreense TaxID=266125 RepID=A0ABV2EK29_9CAUL
MKYLPLGFSIASFLAAGLIALTTSAHALSEVSQQVSCLATSSQSCESGPAAASSSS